MADTNTFSIASGSLTQYWSRRMQRKYFNTAIFKDLANFEEQSTLKKGYRVHRPYRSNLGVNSLGTDGAYSRQALTDTDEYLDVDTKKEVSFFVPEYEEIQHNYKVINEYADDMGKAIGERMDGDFLAQIANATSDVDDNDISGGTSGNGVTVSSSNIYKLFTVAGRKLSRLNVSMDNRVAVLSPSVIEKLEEYEINRDTQRGDKALANGFTGMNVLGFDVYMSNGLYWSGKLLFATNPTDGDTITLSDGVTTVTFTFEDTLSGTEGGVHICSTAALTLDSLVSAIGTPGTDVAEATNTGFTGFNVGTAASNNQLALIKKLTATDGTTYLTLTSSGLGHVAVGETLSATADVWTAALQLQHCYFGRRKAIDMVVQKYPNMAIKDRTGYIGKDVVSWNLYGLKTFTDGAREVVDVKINSSSF